MIGFLIPGDGLPQLDTNSHNLDFSVFFSWIFLNVIHEIQERELTNTGNLDFVYGSFLLVKKNHYPVMWLSV